MDEAAPGFRQLRGLLGDVLWSREINTANRRDVVWNSEKDLNTLRYIRLASLDVMWSRESDTVRDNFRRMQKDWKSAQEELNIGNVFPKMGRPEMEDKNGIRVALVMLHTSRRKGRYNDHLQVDTVRKTATWYMNAYTAITEEDDGTLFAADDKTMFASSSPTRSKWFQRFQLGMKRMMGVSQAGRSYQLRTNPGVVGDR